MPVLSRFYGIIIRMYFFQKEHNPPHSLLFIVLKCLYAKMSQALFFKFAILFFTPLKTIKNLNF